MEVNHSIKGASGLFRALSSVCPTKSLSERGDVISEQLRI
jgi:hypothetical protein